MIINSAQAQVAVGAGLMTTPAWIHGLQEINTVLGFFAALTGVIIGTHGVIQLYRSWRRHRKP